MELFNDTNKSLDRIELLLKSIDFQLTKIAALLMSEQEKEIILFFEKTMYSM